MAVLRWAHAVIDRATAWRMTVARILRTPTSSIAMVLLIALSAATAGAGAGVIASAVGSTDRLFTAAKAPDLVQMHEGAVDADAVAEFADTRPDVVDHQVQTALQLRNGDLVLSGTSDTARDGVMDLLLVTQNPRFDLLLDVDGAPAEVGVGEIGVPLYYADAYGLAIGDPVEIFTEGRRIAFTVGALVQDAQMGPSLVNSKRFLLSEHDADALAGALPAEHIITFLVTGGSADAVAEAYRAAGLPAHGPTVDGGLLRLLTSLTDGLVAAMGLLVSVLLLAVALLCLRIMILTALAEDSRRLGLLRAIGFSHVAVRRALLLSYAVYALAGFVLGAAIAVPLTAVVGRTEPAAVLGAHDGAAVPAAVLVGVLVAALLPLLFAAGLLRRVRRITPTAALRDESSPAPRRRAPRPLRSSVTVPATLRLAARHLSARAGTTALVIALIAGASAMALLPQRVTETIAAPGFVSMMGVGDSDLRLFLRAGVDETTAVPGDLERDLLADPDVTRIAVATTYRATIVDGRENDASVAVDVGDVDTFPLAYTTGGAPDRAGTVALSTLTADGQGLGVGDTVRIAVGDTVVPLRVSGTYHDITNGGRSAKVTAIDSDGAVALWRSVAIELRDGVSVSGKAAALSQSVPGATVTELERFMRFTLGDTVDRLRTVSLVAGSVAVALLLLVFSLRGRLEIARDRTALSLLRRTGWSAGDLRMTTLLRVGAVAVVGTAVGTLVTETMGGHVLGLMLASFGGGSTPLTAPGIGIAALGAAVLVAAPLGAALTTIALPDARPES